APAAPAADDADAKKRAIIAAALERARKKKEALAAQGAGPKNTEGVSAAVQAQIDAAEARRRRLAEQRDAAGEPGRPDDANAAGDDASPPSKTKQ
ncbi:electron transport complex subunit RsxB, partial [Burkholderia pseudomallei]|nr:electron transport complex subunit RsxB [Burkholderia pseudomallei]MCD4555557.1 electron transport complex subunit RsxB [Burkholderia pseudomallei]MDV2233295.1 electron transport complex subunit RsxB [Burkholderia pseudomallei]MEB5485686.1 electron transport complex subunit RsxB [Burkholderia pseudomallei]NVH65415.1 electron transport complex subunit RsxB [Burkholderia pseudomallei]